MDRPGCARGIRADLDRGGDGGAWMMRITIRNRRILTWLGFEPQPGCISSIVSMSLTLWAFVLWRRITGR